MSRISSVALAFVVSLGLPGWTAAQTVQGIILREKSLSPVGGARIAVVDDSGRTVDTTRTDSTSGVFYLNPGKPGHYQLRIQVGRGGLSYSPGFTIDSNETIERKFAVPEWPREVLEAYLPGDVTKKAAYDRGNRPPRYPDGLRAAGRAGVARATVVVNPDGRAAMSTFQVIASDDDAFTDALRDFVDHAHFVPAERDGVKVPQLFEAAADFGFGADPGRLSGDNVVFVRALGVTRRVP